MERFSEDSPLHEEVYIGGEVSCREFFEIIDKQCQEEEAKNLLSDEVKKIKIEDGQPSKTKMELFEKKDLKSWKHVLYNLLVEDYNDPSPESLIRRFSGEILAVQRSGFQLRSTGNAELHLTRLYAHHIWFDTSSLTPVT